MRKVVLGLVVALALVLAPSANAAFPQVFTNTAAPVNCTVQTGAAVLGQRFCGTAQARVPSWDGTPIDVSVALPPVPAVGPDGNFPMVGIYHGWGGSKITPSSAAAQRWVTQGYAVFSISDRGWGASCGSSLSGRPMPACFRGYVHLMSNAYEVRDAQYLMGQLADDGAIDPQKIGATGGSYGGGMSAQLGALKNRTELTDGSLIPWKSPLGTDLEIAAAAPEFPWTDIAQSLVPNGSTLDYVADAPYSGPEGDHRFGIQKQNWNSTLYSAALGGILGYYAPTSPPPNFPDPTADLTNWNTWINTGGPYDSDPKFADLLTELTNHHSAYYVDDSIAPAPMLMSSGWNDDLFPVDETVRYYNKIRTNHPNTPVQLFQLDFGHAPRAASSAADTNKLAAAENAWFAKYVKGTGPTPDDPNGGVNILTSKCPTSGAGTQYTADSWQALAPGEVRHSDAASKTITAPGTAPSNAFTSGSICTTTSGNDNASAATYKLDPAPAGGFTIAGSPTVSADMTVNSPNDGVYARLYDVDPGANTQVLIARQLYRPMDVGVANAPQLFQLHPQGWRVAPGHVVKLELLAQDSQYGRTASNAMPQQSIQVSDLELRLPVVDAPGSLGGFVKKPAAYILPPGYELARDAYRGPDVSNNAPGGVATATYLEAAPDVTVSATDQDSLGEDLSAVAAGLPAGVTLVPENDSGSGPLPGTASWKLAGSSITSLPGTYHVTVTVTDERSLTGTTEFDIKVKKLTQTIDFPSIDDKVLTDADFDPGATASSGLGVSYTANGPCSIVSGLVHVSGIGLCQVTAHQSGNAIYKPAPDDSETFRIRRATDVDLKGSPLPPAKVKAGKVLHLRAKVTSPGITRVSQGHVEFTLDGDPIGGGDVKKNGALGLRGISTTGLSSGMHEFEVTYTDPGNVYATAVAQRPLQIR